MSWYKWMQVKSGKEPWTLFLADHEEQVLRETKPALTTILAADHDFANQSEMTAEDYAKVHYRGPFYTDFDAEDIEDVIPQVQKFLKKLRDDHKFDLEQASIFASGGKGFHVIIPEACFTEKVNSRGVAFLPSLYREMCMGVFVDTLDLRVYTARQGRQFRSANIERPDRAGVYKVPLTLAEMMSITVPLYREYCSGPRHVPAPRPPTYNVSLGLLFAQAKDKIEKFQRTKKKSQLDENLLKKFGGDFPPSIVSLMAGDNVSQDVGFQKIALQLALAAHALGKSEEVFLGMCEGLCDKHKSDGTRYNTPQKRRQELARMWVYCHNNPCYTFSVGGVKSTLAKGSATPDLDNSGHDLGDEAAEGEDEIEWSLTQGMLISTKGIFRKTEAGLVQVSAVGLAAPRQLIDSVTGDTMGYEVDYYLDGAKKGTRVLSMDTFQSRSKLLQFTLAAGGSSVAATDPQVGALADILRSKVAKNGQQSFTASREGLDLIILPGGDIDIIWADNQGVISDLGRNYRLIGRMAQDPEYKTDLRSSPHLVGSDEAGEFFSKLFRMNNKEALGRMIGWYFIAFFNQPLRYMFDQFPYLQVYGPAGAGKTKTNEVLARLHYWKIKPRLMGSSDITKWSIDSLVSSSASIPLLLDEFKPREMSKLTLDKIKSILKGNYTSQSISRGHLSTGTGQNKLESRSVQNCAPLVVIGEALESQTAIMDRAVIVSMDKGGKRGHTEDFMFVQNYREYLSHLGRTCIDRAMAVNSSKLRRTMTDLQLLVAAAIPERAGDADRPVFNIAAVLAGLQFAQAVLGEQFGTTFDSTFQEFQDEILGAKDNIIPRSMSEAAKVLDTIAHLSHGNPHEDKNVLVFGVDYVTNPPKNTVEIHLRNAFTKYVRFKRSLGEETLYDNYEAFAAGMHKYAGVVDKVCIDSPMKVAMSMQVFAFDSDYLEKEGVGLFGQK